MSIKKIFLTARWENLVIISYKVSHEILEPYIPKGLELDTIEGSAFVSIVAFDFLDTKVKGIKVPFNDNFPEINLRFYVKNNEMRGVVFIKEFVSKFFIPLIANTIYNECYRRIPMKSNIRFGDNIYLDHSIHLNDKDYSINVEAKNKTFMPHADSTEHFFKEHEWGFGIGNKGGRTVKYRVEHPSWELYPITKFEHSFNFAEIYGNKWKSLNDEKPYNIAFAKGSHVKVFGREIL